MSVKSSLVRRTPRKIGGVLVRNLLRNPGIRGGVAVTLQGVLVCKLRKSPCKLQ